MEGLAWLTTSFILWVRQFAQPWLTNVFLGITALGSVEYWSMVALPIVYWLINKRFGIRFAAFFAFSAYINSSPEVPLCVPCPPEELRLTVQEGYFLPQRPRPRQYHLLGL